MSYLPIVFINQKGDISDDSVGIFIPLDDDKYATLTDCGGVSLYKQLAPFTMSYLPLVFINQRGDIIRDDSVGIFIPLDDDKYATLTDCGGVSLYKQLTSLTMSYPEGRHH
jgi:hypothetical protein